MFQTILAAQFATINGFQYYITEDPMNLECAIALTIIAVVFAFSKVSKKLISCK
jgi:hypothetical protein